MKSCRCLLLWLTICSFACAADHIRLPMRREAFDRRTGQTSTNTSGVVESAIDKDLYWYGYFDVGDSKNLKILIDTGSNDLILNPHLYKPSKNATRFNGHQHFSTEYDGINRPGYGFVSMHGKVYRDTVTGGGLSVPDQAFGVVHSFKYTDAHPLPYAVQNDGNIGFSPRPGSSFTPEVNSWFYNLCKDEVIEECRVGLALGTNGTGETILGRVATELIDGPLTYVTGLGPFFLKADVTIDNEIFLRDQILNTDCGTDNIQAPINQAEKIFAKLGYHTHMRYGKNLFFPKEPAEMLFGWFPCDNPPTIGCKYLVQELSSHDADVASVVSFPSTGQLKPGEKGRIFNVSPAEWDVYNHGNNNCTSILGGTNFQTNPKTGYGEWLLGQSFFAGHYMDFNVKERQIGIGNLKNPAG